MINLKRILVPTDFSEHSKNALRYAAAFGEKFGAEVYLLHVFQDLAIFQPDAVTVGPVTPPIDEMLAAARTALERSLADCRIKNVAFKIEVREGTPFEAIVDFAKTQNIDLIVLGTHGRGWLAHVLMGSVAEKVVRKSPCPVLTVRHPEHEFVEN